MSTTKEKIKTILICVLVAGMLYFTATVWFYDSPFGEMELSSLFDMPEYEAVGKGAESDIERFGIRPLAIVASDETSRRGAVYSQEEIDAAYSYLRPGIAECIRRAKTLSETGLAEWDNALFGSGILLDYRSDIPFSVLRSWFSGSRTADSANARYVLVSTDKKNAKVYIKSSDGRRIFSADTDLSSESVLSLISGFSGTEVNFATDFEDKNFAAIAKETVVPKKTHDLAVLSPYNASANFNEKTEDAFLDVFGLKEATPTQYSEKDGTKVYIADRVTLKISPQGNMVYTDTRNTADETLGISVESDSEIPSLSEKTEAARHLTASIANALLCDGGIYLVSVSETADGTEVVFGRHIDGIPIDMAQTMRFSEIRIKDSTVVSARFNTGSYMKSAKRVSYVPERITAAAVAGSGKTGDVNLRYQGSAGDEVTALWYIGGLHKTEE